MVVRAPLRAWPSRGSRARARARIGRLAHIVVAPRTLGRYTRATKRALGMTARTEGSVAAVEGAFDMQLCRLIETS